MRGLFFAYKQKTLPGTPKSVFIFHKVSNIVKGFSIPPAET